MELKGYQKLNPLHWQKRTIKRVLIAFYAIAVPIYLYIGFQPANATIGSNITKSAETASDHLDKTAVRNTTKTVTSSDSTDAATQSTQTNTLSIPSIDLFTSVEPLYLTAEHTLETPDTIAGSYAPYKNKTLLIGHSSTVFQDLQDVRVGDNVIYNEKNYRVIRREIATKENIDMYRLIKAEKDDLLVIMTCAGQPIGDRDATHRLLVTAIEEK